MSAQPNPTMTQIFAVSYNAVLNKKRGPTNQWADNSLMQFLQKFGMLEKRSFGPMLELGIDFRRNPSTTVLATDMEAVSRAKTEVISTALYAPASISESVVWSKEDEMKNPSENQKFALAKALLNNAFESHDDIIEEALFGTTTNGLLGLATIVPTSGQGTVGTIDAGAEVFWRNPTDSYLADGSDLEAVLDEVYLTAQKGSGSKSKVKLLVSGAEALALYNSTQQVFQRFNGSELDAGFVTSAYKGARFIHSQYGGTNIYGLSDGTKLYVSKEMFRHKGETSEQDDNNSYIFKIFSGVQFATECKSRNFVVSEA